VITFALCFILWIVAPVLFKQFHHADINETKIRLQQAKQRQQLIMNVCSRLNESHYIDWGRFYVSDQRKYIYCATPKAACSSWKLTLLRLTGKDLSRVANVHLPQMTDKILKRAIHYNTTRRESLLRKYFKFMFVREPLERLVSAYLDKCFRDPIFRGIPQTIKKRRHLSNNTDQGETTKH